jgi:ribonuclease D
MRPLLVQGDLPEQAARELAATGEVGLDCEMMGLNPVRDRLCTVQIGSEKSTPYVIQVREDQGAPRLKELLENDSVVKIFHFARIDIRYIKERLGIDTRNIFCTKIASRLARTYTDRHGLKELVREFIGDQLDKTNQSSDWGREDLTSEQLRYAADDVVYLFRLKKILTEMLKREGRYELAQVSFEYLPTLIELDRLGYEHIFDH